MTSLSFASVDHQQRGADRGWRRTRRPGRDRVGALLVRKTQTSTRVSDRLKILVG